MTRTALILTIFLGVALPATAQDVPAPDDEAQNDFREGFSLLEEGSRRLLQGLVEEFGPAMRELQEAMRDMSAYYPPEMLPNGDIIIRRRTPRPVEPPEDGDIEL